MAITRYLGINMARPSIPIVDRFWSKVDKTDRCWNWTAFKDRDGYGFIGVNGVPKRVHRVVLGFEGSDIPSGMIVCHHCDNPGCVNPDHLFIGAVADNVADKMAKGRAIGTPMPGEKNGFAKLTDSQARVIKSDKRTCRAVAKDYNVGKSTINNIQSGKTWRHV